MSENTVYGSEISVCVCAPIFSNTKGKVVAKVVASLKKKAKNDWL